MSMYTKPVFFMIQCGNVMGDGNNRTKDKMRACEHYSINLYICLLTGWTEMKTYYFSPSYFHSTPKNLVCSI